MFTDSCWTRHRWRRLLSPILYRWLCIWQIFRIWIVFCRMYCLLMTYVAANTCAVEVQRLQGLEDIFKRVLLFPSIQSKSLTWVSERVRKLIGVETRFVRVFSSARSSTYYCFPYFKFVSVSSHWIKRRGENHIAKKYEFWVPVILIKDGSHRNSLWVEFKKGGGGLFHLSPLSCSTISSVTQQCLVMKNLRLTKRCKKNLEGERNRQKSPARDKCEDVLVQFPRRVVGRLNGALFFSPPPPHHRHTASCWWYSRKWN